MQAPYRLAVFTFVIKRQAGTVLVLWLVSVLTFVLVYLIPGDPARAYAGPRASEEVVARIRQEMGLDAPLPEQYLGYLGRLLRGDFGHSLYGGEVLPLILARLPATLQLALAALSLELLIGLPMGVLAANRPGSWVDRLLLLLTVVGTCIPSFWLGIVLLYTFGYRFDVLPLGGSGTPAHLILPAFVLSVGGAAFYARILRSSMLDVLSADYIRTAWAKGLGKPAVLWRHAVRNAILPVVTVAGLDLAYLLGGVIVVETVFAWPGIGYMTWQAVGRLDVPVIMGTVIFSALFVAVASLLADVAYTVLDPRVRLS